MNRDASDLKQYAVNLYRVREVNNEGEQCEFCAEVDQVVQVNLYLPGRVYAECCFACVPAVLDYRMTDTSQAVLLELAA